MKYDSVYHKMDFNFGILFASFLIFHYHQFFSMQNANICMSKASHINSVVVNKDGIVDETTDFATKKFAESP